MFLLVFMFQNKVGEKMFLKLSALNVGMGGLME